MRPLDSSLAAAAFLVIVMAAGLVGCIERKTDATGFACGWGGECPDASSWNFDAAAPDGSVLDSGPGPDGGRDAGLDAGRDAGRGDAGRGDAGRGDAGPPDAAPRDSGVPPDSGIPMNPVACTPSGDIPIAGERLGVSGTVDAFEVACNQGRSPEVVYRLVLPTPVEELRVDTRGSSFDTVLAIYGAQCGGAGELGCNDDADEALTSEVVLTNVAAGTYFLAVEGYAGGAGGIRLNVRARTAGTACSPLPLLECPRTAVSPRLAAGGAHTCVEMFGDVRCWGENASDQLGRTTPRSSHWPLRVDGLGPAGALGGGADFTCSIAAGSEVLACWGANDQNQVAPTRDRTVPMPTPIDLSEGARGVAGGESHGCALLSDQTVACWGGNEFGALGDGTLVSSSTPVRAGELEGVVRLEAGARHTCVVLLDETVWCWGDNTSGQVGDDAQSPQLEPSLVPGVEGAVGVAAGDAHTCVLMRNGTVLCFGANEFGQLGDGTTVSRGRAALVVGVSDAVGIFAGARHSCALLASGGVSCWGDNEHGQLGDGTTTLRSTATTVLGLTGVGRLALGDAHSCASLASGDVHCWGQNADGQVGVPGRGDVLDPAQAARFPVTADGAPQRWLVLGRFSNAACGLDDTAAIDELAASPRPGDVEGGETWTPLRAECIVPNCNASAALDLNCQYGFSANIYAYMFAYVFAPDERPAEVLVGYDDGLRAYVNGEEAALGAQDYCGACLRDSSYAPVTLQAGLNRVLLKLSSGGGGWEATLRFVTLTGEPMTDLQTSLSP